jgi:hypothetical protein
MSIRTGPSTITWATGAAGFGAAGGPPNTNSSAGAVWSICMPWPAAAPIAALGSVDSRSSAAAAIASSHAESILATALRTGGPVGGVRGVTPGGP